MTWFDQFSLGTEEDDLRAALELSEQENEKSADLDLTSDDSTVEDNVDDGADSESEDLDFESRCNLIDSEFRLHAIVSHCGQSASSGHYVSDIFDHEHKQWNRYDDAMVSSLGDALRAQRSEWRTGGYLFVYIHTSCYTGQGKNADKDS